MSREDQRTNARLGHTRNAGDLRLREHIVVAWRKHFESFDRNSARKDLKLGFLMAIASTLVILLFHLSEEEDFKKHPMGFVILICIFCLPITLDALWRACKVANSVYKERTHASFRDAVHFGFAMVAQSCFIAGLIWWQMWISSPHFFGAMGDPLCAMGINKEPNCRHYQIKISDCTGIGVDTPTGFKTLAPVSNKHLNACILFEKITVGNSGVPGMIKDWHIHVVFPDGQEIIGWPAPVTGYSRWPDAKTGKVSIYPAEDNIFVKTSKPIEKGSLVSGFAEFMVLDTIPELVNGVGNKFVVFFSNSDGRTYAITDTVTPKRFPTMQP